MTGYTTDDLAITLAREAVYRFLAAALRHPSERLRELRDPASMATFHAATELLRAETGDDELPLGFGELAATEFDAMELIAWLNSPPDDLFAEYDRVFGLGPTADFPPYETEFCPNQEPFYRAQQMADIAGFYRAFGLHVLRERPDHIALEFEFMGLLLAMERLACEARNPSAEAREKICRETQDSFLSDHLTWWVPSYAAGMQHKARTGPYAALGRMLAAFLPMERSRFSIKAPKLPVRPQSIEPPEAQGGCEGCSSAS